MGRARLEDLVRAERFEEDHDLRVSAGLVLQLLGDSRCGEWSGSEAPKGTKPIAICSSKLTEPVLAQLEKTFAVRPCEKTQSCKEEDFPDIDDSVTSALFINGSPRAQTVLARMRELAGASGMQDGMIADTLTQISEFKTAPEMRKGIAVDDPGLADWLQRNAFFFSEGERDGADVEILARTPDNDRLLAQVSYHCGPKCGRGYYVVLERAGKMWHLALARMVWIA